MLSRVSNLFMHSPVVKNFTEVGKCFFANYLQNSSLHRTEFDLNVIDISNAYLEKEHPIVWQDLKQNLVPAETVSQHNINMSAYMAEKHPTVLLNLQKHIFSHLYDTSILGELTPIELPKDTEMVGGFSHRHYPLLNGVVMHPNDLSHELFVIEQATQGDHILFSKLKENTPCLRGQMTMEGEERVQKFFLVDHEKLAPFKDLTVTCVEEKSSEELDMRPK